MKAQSESEWHLTDDQVAEVKHRLADFAAGPDRNATEEEMAAFWKTCGL